MTVGGTQMPPSISNGNRDVVLRPVGLRYAWNAVRTAWIYA